MQRRDLVTLYLPSGTTLQFKGVSNYAEEGGRIKFDYISATTGRKSSADFDASGLVGISVSDALLKGTDSGYVEPAYMVN